MPYSSRWIKAYFKLLVHVYDHFEIFVKCVKDYYLLNEVYFLTLNNACGNKISSTISTLELWTLNNGVDFHFC